MMTTRRTVLGRTAGLALLAGLLAGAPAAAVSYGRIGFTKMAVDDCTDMFGTCEWKLTCKVAGGADTEIVGNQSAGVAQDVELEKSFEAKSFPAKLECSLQEDDGWFGESWNDAGKASLDLPGGGDYELKFKGDQGAVTVTAVVDSFEMPDSLASAPPAQPDKAKKPAPRPAPRQLVGGYLKDPSGHAVVLGLPWNDFKARADAFDAQGVKLVKMEHWEAGGQRLWAGIFRSQEGKQQLETDLEYKEPFTRWKKLHDDGMRIVDLEAYAQDKKFVFVAAFQEGVDEDQIWVGDLNSFVREWSRLSGAGLRLMDLELLQASGVWLRAGAFRGGSGPYGLKNALTWAQLQEWWTGKEREGRTSIVDLASYKDGGKELWDIATGGGQGRMTPKLDLAAFAKDWNDRLAQGFRLTALEAAP